LAGPPSPGKGPYKDWLQVGMRTSYTPHPLFEQTDRDGDDCPGRPAGRLFGPTGSLAGWSVAVAAHACLWGGRHSGCLHRPPAARDKEGQASRDNPGCGKKKVCAQDSVCVYVCVYVCMCVCVREREREREREKERTVYMYGGSRCSGP
jgi:hypothetical protein